MHCIPLFPDFVWLSVLVSMKLVRAYFPTLKGLALCSTVPCDECVYLVVLASWWMSGCKIGFSWYGGSYDMVPEMQSWWTLWRVTGWTPVGSALVRRGSWATIKSGHTPWISWIGALSPLCLLACMTVHSRSLGTALGNYCIGCPPGPVCGMESGSMHIPPQPLDSLGYSKEIPSRNLCTLLAAMIRHCVSECMHAPSKSLHD